MIQGVACRFEALAAGGMRTELRYGPGDDEDGDETPIGDPPDDDDGDRDDEDDDEDEDEDDEDPLHVLMP
jgi:hypothetical protein